MENLADQYEAEGKKSAEVIARSRLSKERLKSYLAVITLEFITSAGSVSRAEAAARASERYRKYLEIVCKEIAASEVARSRMVALQMASDHQRSVNALERAKMSLV